MNFSVGNPVPAITSLSPTSVAVGSGAQTLTINGTGFLSTSTVSYNGSTRTTTFVSSTQLTLALTSTDVGHSRDVPRYGDESCPGWRHVERRELLGGESRPDDHLPLANFCCGRFGGANSDHQRHGLLEYFDGELQRLKPHAYLCQQHPTDARSRQH